MQLAMAVGTSHFVPLPVFTHTLTALLGEAHRRETHTSDALTCLEAGDSVAGLGSSTASNSINANMLAEPLETPVYADVYLYVQALCYLVIVQATVLLAASISVVTYLDSLLLRFPKWIWSDNPYSAVWDVFLPGHGMPLHVMLQKYKQWWVSMDIQWQDVDYVLSNLGFFWTFSVTVQRASNHLPYWLCKAVFLVCCWLFWPPVVRVRQLASMQHYGSQRSCYVHAQICRFLQALPKPCWCLGCFLA
jgi:hypothetical protein